MESWRLLLTRTAPDCYQQASDLKAQGVESQCFPMIEIKATPATVQQHQQLLNFNQYTGVIVTSKPAAQLLLQRLQSYYPTPILNHQAWFTVGHTTAGVLKKAGIISYTPTQQDTSEALWQLTDFQQLITRPHQHILIAKGIAGRPWMLEKLKQHNIIVDTIELYQRQLPHYTTDEFIQKIMEHNINAIVISSGQGLYNLYNLAKSYWQQVVNIVFFVPSERVAQTAKELGAIRVINCKGASLQSLLSTLAYTKMSS